LLLVVKWATDALDVVRREIWNAARKGGETAVAKQLKDARFALWKNPADLTRRQRGKLARIAEVNRSPYRAYLLKEELWLVFRVKDGHGVALLDAWVSWARRCRIPAFVALAKTVAAHRAGIVAALQHGLSNARVESVNTKLRVLTRLAFGFRSPGGPDRAGDAERRGPMPGSARTHLALHNTNPNPLVDDATLVLASIHSETRRAGYSKRPGLVSRSTSTMYARSEVTYFDMASNPLAWPSR